MSWLGPKLQNKSPPTTNPVPYKKRELSQPDKELELTRRDEQVLELSQTPKGIRRTCIKNCEKMYTIIKEQIGQKQNPPCSDASVRLYRYALI